MKAIEKSDRIEIPEKNTGSKSRYRESLEKFINSDMTTGRIECEYIAQAEAIQKGLKRFKRIDEKILIERRGNIVWLMKLRSKESKENQSI